MASTQQPRFVIVGGGLSGSLAACYLGSAGYPVDVYELRGDMRIGSVGGGKSINLALSHRGIEGLRRVGLAEKVLADAVPMYGRTIHAADGSLSFQPYGRDTSQCINSVSRGQLNVTLLNAADAYDSVNLHFDRKCTDVDVDSGEVRLEHTDTGESGTVQGDIIISADGAFSAVRRAMQRRDGFDFSQSWLQHGYKELVIPPGPGGTFLMEKNALHIWPRRSFMMIALPNADGSFTCTLFWPFKGDNSFESIKTEGDLLRFFTRNFPDAVPLMPTLPRDYFTNPVGSLVTIRTDPWYHKDKVLLLGDAAHAIVPFYGQGMNAGFEDVLVMGECMDRLGDDWGRILEATYVSRKHHVDALADLALYNFVEMRDNTGKRRFLWRKRLERVLHRLFPAWYVPLYSMATFTRIPYAQAVRRAKRQDRVVLAAACAVALTACVVGAGWMLGWQDACP